MVKTTEIEETFKEFLKENGVKLAFEKEIKKAGQYKTLNKYLERYAWHKYGVHRLVSHAFPFIYSEAGREFWLNIHNEWCKKIAR
jgi:hypothetical protein